MLSRPLIVFLCLFFASACDDAKPGGDCAEPTAGKTAKTAKADKTSAGSTKTWSATLIVGIEGDPTGPVTIVGKGPDAQEFTATTPLAVDDLSIDNLLVQGGLASGNWTVVLSAPGHRDKTLQVVIPERGTTKRSVELRLLGGKLALEGGAKVGKRLKNMDGVDVPTDAGGTDPGVYKLPGQKRYAVVSKGRTTTAGAASADGGHEIEVAGRRVVLDDDVKVVLWGAPGGFDFAKKNAAMLKKGKPALMTARGKKAARIATDDLKAIRDTVTTVMLHTDLSDDSAGCFKALHSRSLSTHFMIDFDGTIYQSMDVAFMAFHGGSTNPTSIGIDLNNRGANLVSKKNANAKPYDEKHPRYAEMQKHPRKKSARTRINFGRVQHFGYTEAQYRSLSTLLRALVAIFPKIKPEFPRTSAGGVLMFALEDGAAFRGILAHWHNSATRWDPGPGFDWERVGKALTLAPKP